MKVPTVSRDLRIRSLALALAWALALAQTPLWATPPGHAPAHGWRKKHDPYYMGYTGNRWEADYGITLGRCNRDAVGAVIGGIAGGVAGSQIGKGDGNKIAILVGTALGAVIGAKIGRDMDRRDEACIGHALELARDGQSVVWTGDGGLRYQLKPLSGFSQDGQPCRRFELRIAGERVLRSACQAVPGTWELR